MSKYDIPVDEMEAQNSGADNRLKPYEPKVDSADHSEDIWSQATLEETAMVLKD
jgi:hypothetical protein